MFGTTNFLSAEKPQFRKQSARFHAERAAVSPTNSQSTEYATPEIAYPSSEQLRLCCDQFKNNIKQVTLGTANLALRIIAGCCHLANLIA